MKGEQYLKKMIQIPVTLPSWDNKDVVTLIRDLIKQGIVHDSYKNIIEKNIELISLTVENNPREIKRFLNNFIIAFEVFSSKKYFKPEELLILQAIQIRWSDFYNLLIKENKHFIDELNKYVKMDDQTRIKILDLDEVKEAEDYDLRIRKQLGIFKADTELWEFLAKTSYILGSVESWEIYRRATELGVEPTLQEINNKTALALLRKGNIKEFNKGRGKEFAVLNLQGVYLGGVELI